MFPDLLRDDVFRLETRRLWLRWPRAADAAAIAALAGEPDVAEMTARVPYPYPKGAAAEFVLTARAGNLDGKALTLVLALKHRPSEPVGCIDLRAEAPDEAILGYWLGRPFWGQGLMSEAALGLTRLAFQFTDVSAIVAAARIGNARSARVLAACSFAEEGAGVLAAPARGGSIPVDHFRLTRAAWRGDRGGSHDWADAARSA